MKEAEIIKIILAIIEVAVMEEVMVVTVTVTVTIIDVIILLIAITTIVRAMKATIP